MSQQRLDRVPGIGGGVLRVTVGWHALRLDRARFNKCIA